jgi:hypothetical protein
MESNIINLIFRLPDGNKIQRRFQLHDKVEVFLLKLVTFQLHRQHRNERVWRPVLSRIRYYLKLPKTVFERIKRYFNLRYIFEFPIRTIVCKGKLIIAYVLFFIFIYILIIYMYNIYNCLLK